MLFFTGSDHLQDKILKIGYGLQHPRYCFILPDQIINKIYLIMFGSEFWRLCFILLFPIIYMEKIMMLWTGFRRLFFLPDPIINNFKLWFSNLDFDAFYYISADIIIYKIKIWWSDPNLDDYCFEAAWFLQELEQQCFGKAVWALAPVNMSASIS